MSPPPQTFNTKLFKKEKLTGDTFSFYFKRPQGFDFLAGQYIKMTLDIKNPDERGTSRFFTIASSPTENHLMITTRIVQSSFKKTLASLKIGSRVKMRGPHGAFVLEEKDKRARVFLAGGIGITPFRSMSIYTRDQNLKIPIVLIVSFSTAQDLIFYDELSKITDNFRLIATITHPERSNWYGETGRIDADKVKKYVTNPKEAVYYIAGPQALVDAMIELTKSLGVSQDQVKTENFPGY